MDLAQEIARNVAAALEEDIGAGDLTAALVPAEQIAHARVIAKSDAVICGAPWFDAVYRQVDTSVSVRWLIEEGQLAGSGMALCELRGRARSLLTGERTALNFLQTLSAAATRTRRFVDAVAGTRARILDTRKTLPGLRQALKYAVRCGGGANHRMGLYDGILIKENHIAAAGTISAAVAQARRLHPERKLEVEVETLRQLEEAIAARADIALLDNFSLADTRAAVVMAAGSLQLEASGSIDDTTIRAVAETGVDYISLGIITKQVIPLDLSMRFV